MFASIAKRYDRANTVLSGGVHHRWRREAVRWSGAREGDSVLDCATGTGDLAIAFKRAVGSGRVVGTDFVPEMLDVARRKSSAVTFDVADVTALPYPDGSFDISSIAFGIRNVHDIERGIRELARVVRSGGRVMILELGRPSNRAFGLFFEFYRHSVLPHIGGAVTGRKQAYQYLESSSASFPCGEEFAAIMRATNQFSSVEWKPLTFGIAYLYKGVKV
jgi:demethylmenaquinone methyltransferase / 2-methoxy-6-polyprenyl-1,4-benzoquinol methylase